jgi:hypothetical protein
VASLSVTERSMILGMSALLGNEKGRLMRRPVQFFSRQARRAYLLME